MTGETPFRVLEIKSKLDWEGASYDLTHRVEFRDITEVANEDTRGPNGAVITLPGPSDTRTILNELFALAAASKSMILGAREAKSSRESAECLSGAEGALESLIDKATAFGAEFGVAVRLAADKKAGKGSGAQK